MQRFILRGILLCCLIGLSVALNGQTQNNALDDPKLQGCVRFVCSTVYEAIVENGVIGKGDKVITTGDTLFYNPDGTPINLFIPHNYSADSISYQYDTFGRCVKISIYYPNKQLRESRTLVYNEQGYLKLCIVRSTDEEVVDAISYTYDPYGKLAIKIYNRKDGEMHQQRFAYDQKGNWIVRVDFQEYEPIYYVERQIEYYPE